MPAVFARALVYEFQNRCRFAEKFLKIDVKKLVLLQIFKFIITSKLSN